MIESRLQLHELVSQDANNKRRDTMKFEELWENHPTIKSRLDDAPCKVNGRRAFENQCAIRLGDALINSAVDISTFKGVRCWHNHTPGHILRAEELANWLTSAFSPFRRVLKFPAKEGFSNINGKTRIIFFKDFYGPGNTGDHIDLWNGRRLTRYSSWFQFTFNSGQRYADAEVWFWPVG